MSTTTFEVSGEAKEAEYYFASDASAVIEHTNKVIFLEDNDVAAVREGSKLQWLTLMFSSIIFAETNEESHIFQITKKKCYRQVCNGHAVSDSPVKLERGFKVKITVMSMMLANMFHVHFKHFLGLLESCQSKNA